MKKTGEKIIHDFLGSGYGKIRTSGRSYGWFCAKESSYVVAEILSKRGEAV